MSTVQGHCDPRFEKLHDALDRAIADGEEVGAAIAIDIDGETVVDIWGGWADADDDHSGHQEIHSQAIAGIPDCEGEHSL